jgi:signal transduction histidine kinase
MIVRTVERSRSRRRLERLEAQRKLEQERARIAKDIHDDLGASLTHITMLSQSARAHLGDLPEAGAEVDQIYGTARELTRSMEEVVWAVSPKHDTLDSLANYLGIYAQDFAAASGLRCRLDLPAHLSQRPLNSQARHNVFLAFKEALHNVARHATASEVRVSLKQDERAFTLAVEDNGRGFRTEETASDPPAPGTRQARLLSGHGLANMRSRLQEAGGRCEIQSHYGLGTTVRFVVPFVA